MGRWLPMPQVRSRQPALRQKTCWAFKPKVMKAIKSFGNYPITGTAKVGETVFGGQEEGVRGRKNGTKKIVVAGIEKKKKGVSRLYARQIYPVPTQLHWAVTKDHIPINANVTTGHWGRISPTRYRSLRAKREATSPNRTER
ncbi:hypothetical protein MNBD_BACTEROID03-1464 [hydrothermal vent metagenome]|uniref:Uncharacterized protein n=1 Tax=hydrothermal vent metagenome TaxID=652676 RepID=A0A3B0T8Q5_9ZZZZ